MTSVRYKSCSASLCPDDAGLVCSLVSKTATCRLLSPAEDSSSRVSCQKCLEREDKDLKHLRHDPICKKVFNKKRKPFSSLEQTAGNRNHHCEAAAPAKEQPEKKSNWRQHHEDFINTVQSAKQVTKALKEGHPLPPPPPPSINPENYPGIVQKTRKTLGVSPGKKSSREFGPQTRNRR